MFTWICPQCGREVPPSYSECPTCAERGKAGAGQPARPPAAAPPPPPPPQPAPQYQAPPAYQPPPPQYAPPPPPQPAYQPPPQYPAPQAYQPPPPPPQYEAPPAYPPPPPQYAPPQAPQPVYTLGDEGKKGMPTWAAALLTILVLGGALFGLYKLMGNKNGAADRAGKAAQEQAPVAGHPYMRYLEVTGFRIFESPQKKAMIKYSVINHGAADLSGVELRVTFTSSKAGPGDAPLAVVNAKVGNIEPYGSKEVESVLDTKQRYYELPDWQFLRASVEVTAPK